MHCQLSEERTRKEMIDPQSARAGWYLRDHLLWDIFWRGDLPVFHVPSRRFYRNSEGIEDVGASWGQPSGDIPLGCF